MRPRGDTPKHLDLLSGPWRASATQPAGAIEGTGKEPQALHNHCHRRSRGSWSRPAKIRAPEGAGRGAAGSAADCPPARLGAAPPALLSLPLSPSPSLSPPENPAALGSAAPPANSRGRRSGPSPASSSPPRAAGARHVTRRQPMAGRAAVGGRHCCQSERAQGGRRSEAGWGGGGGGGGRGRRGRRSAAGVARWLRPHPPLREFALRGGGGSEAAAATLGLASPHAPAGAEGESVAGDKQGGGGGGGGG